MNKYLKWMGAMLLLGGMVSCSDDEFQTSAGSEQRLFLSFEASQQDVTRASFDSGSGLVKWDAGEEIGVTATLGGNFTEAFLQPFTGGNATASNSATFSGSLAGSSAGTYRLFALSPYTVGTPSATPTLTLPNIQQPETDSWDPSCCFMMGISAEQSNLNDVSEATGALTFSHMVGWLNLSFSGFTDCAAERVQYVRISTNTAIAGDFTVDLKNQSISTSNAVHKFIIADYSAKNITLGALQSCITLFPGTYASLDIAVKTTGHYIECTRTGLTVSGGEMVSAEVTYANGATVKTSQEDLSASTLPSMSTKTTGTLNVLLLGHSFGIDCTEHLPGLLEDAGITNFNLSRCYMPDCELEEYWKLINDVYVGGQAGTGCPASYAVRNGAVMQNQTTPKVVDILTGTKWDIVILQQSTCDGRTQSYPNWGGSADYSTYQPWLSLLMEYIVSTQRTRQNNTPYMVWNMIDASKTYWQDKYSLIVSATTSMKAETGIRLVITPGTAMYTARTDNSFSVDFTDASIYHNLCRDLGSNGWHASEGLGRYLEACTWFEQLVCPVYSAADANLTVVGNSFRPTAKCSEAGWTINSVNYDEVTAEKAAALQAIAHHTKTNNPFASTNPQ